MKNQLKITSVMMICICLFVGIACENANNTDKGKAEETTTTKPTEKETLTAKPATRTALVISNTTSKSVEVAVVLAALGGGCSSNNPPITADQLQKMGFCANVVESGNPPYAGKCTFTLGPNASKNFPDIPNTCISGNVTFGGYPSCPNSSFPQGYTTAEFTLNPTSGAEAFDISMVNGYNNQITMSTSGGGTWAYGPNNTPITSIKNNALGQNIGNPGVYPQNCTDCIRLVGASVCPSFPTSPTCQGTRICNIQRAYNQNGGTVTIALN